MEEGEAEVQAAYPSRSLVTPENHRISLGLNFQIRKTF